MVNNALNKLLNNQNNPPINPYGAHLDTYIIEINIEITKIVLTKRDILKTKNLLKEQFNIFLFLKIGMIDEVDKTYNDPIIKELRSIISFFKKNLKTGTLTTANKILNICSLFIPLSKRKMLSIASIHFIYEIIQKIYNVCLMMKFYL